MIPNGGGDTRSGLRALSALESYVDVTVQLLAFSRSERRRRPVRTANQFTCGMNVGDDASGAAVIVHVRRNQRYHGQ